MKALDTNLVLRFLVADDQKQTSQVRQLLIKGELAGERFFITIPVVLESLWVLSKVYKRSREAILDAFEALLQMQVLEFEAPQRLRDLIIIGRKSKADLSDLLIGLTARDSGCKATLTFDKKAAETDLFSLLAGEL